VTATIIVNSVNYPATATWGQNDTSSTVAGKLVTAINTAAGSIVSAKLDGDSVSLTAIGSGTGTDYTVTASTADTESATYPAVFNSPSFSAESIDMTGGEPAESSNGILYSYLVSADGYAPNSNLLGYTDFVMGTWSYNYDTLNRLTTAQNIAVSSVPTSSQFASMSGCWSYDGFGNRLVPEIWQTTPCTPPTQFTNPPSNNQLPATLASYDAAGNVITDLTNANKYLYDADGRLCAVQNNAIPSSPVMTEYFYDASGTRVGKTPLSSWPTSCAAPTSAPTTQYLLGQGGEQVTELSVSGSNVTAVHSNVFVSGKLLATYDLPSAGLHFPLTDPLGTKRMQAGISSTGTGFAELGCLSLPFGNGLGNPRATDCVPLSSGATDDTEQHFTGKDRDAESGNDYFFARYYGSSMGRFLSPDSFGGHLEDPQTLNRYSYVGNNPLVRTDPDGHDFYMQCGSSDHKGCTQVQTDPNNSKSTQWVQAGSDGKATIITSDSIRAGQNTATMSENGLQVNGSQGIYFDNAASHSTDANGNDVNHNSLDLAGSGDLKGFNFHVDGNCGGTCLSSGNWSAPGMTSSDARGALNAHSFTIPFEDARAGFGGGEHPFSNQFRFGGSFFGCAVSSCPNTPHLSVPYDPSSAFPKYSVPAAGTWHVDAHSGWFAHGQDIQNTH
jgi:RHS repeat-associated protein